MPWLILAVTGGAALALWRASAIAAHQRAEDLLAHRADEIVSRIEDRLREDEEVLLGALGLFQATGGEVTREAWRSFVGALGMERRYPGLQGVGFARRTPASERTASSAVVLLEPLDWRNARALGYDGLSEPTRRAAMERARDGGEPALSGRVVLVQEIVEEPQSGVLMFVPAYRPGATPRDPAARRAGLVGWIYGPIRIGELVHHTVPQPPTDLTFAIAEASGALLFASHPAPAVPAEGLVLRRDLEVLGQRWVFSFAALPPLAAHAGARRGGGWLAAVLTVGVLLGAVAFVLQRKAELRLLAEEAERRRILFEVSPDGIVLLDPVRGTFTEFNTAAHAQLGYTRPEFARLALFDIEAAGEGQERGVRELAVGVRSGRADFETLHRTKDGEVRRVHVTAQVIQVNGRTVHQCVWRDVSERYRMEEALREAHLRLQRIGDNLPGGYVFQRVQSPAGDVRFTYVSAGVEDVHGLAPAAVLQDPAAIGRLCGEEDRTRLAEAEERGGRELTPVRADVRTRSASGAPGWVRVSEAPTRLGDGSVQWDGVTLDITDWKRAEEDRLVADRLESTGVLAGGIAHDLNNLLTAVELGAELVRSEVGTASAREALETVAYAAQEGKGLTDQLVMFSRRGEPRRQATELEPLVRGSALDALNGSAVVPRFLVEAGLRRARVDGAQIGQVVRNLVVNAREAMPGGGVVTLALRNVTVGLEDGRGAPGEYVELAVTDQGSGIPPDVLPRIFDPYFSTKQRGPEKGMGLGLTICHAVVKRHGGFIALDSTPGEGATFRVLLPAA